MRLLAVGTGIPGRYRAGLELVLDPGVKTYWRTPGEAGVPPLLEWGRSQNLSRAEQRWPVPASFVDGGSTGFGYKRRVVFPIEIAAADATKPVASRLDLDFAICKDICIPIRTELDLSLDVDAPPDKAAAAILDDAELHVPRAGEIGGPGPLAFEAVRLVRSAGPAALEVTLRSIAAPSTELFVETPDDWPLAHARRIGGEAGRIVYEVPLPRFNSVKGSLLRLTAAVEGRGIEIELDPADLPAGP